MRITTFNAIKNRNKKPKSPYDNIPGNDTFEFTTVEVNTLKECFEILSDNWVLSNSICINEPLITTRKKKNLSEYRCSKPGCSILDIDNITKYEDMKNIIDFFKNSEFNVILGKSKNWDGKNNFNIKGYIETSFDNNWNNAKKFMNILNELIGKGGKIDPSAAADVSVQAPLFRNEILLHKLDSTTKIDNDFLTLNEKYIETKKQNEFVQIVDTTKLIHLCYEIYMKKGFSIVASRGETINWEHPSEVKSKGGYFSYIDSPHIMHHHDKDKSLNIFNEIRQTPEGQEFIKEQTAYELKKQFEEHKKSYRNELMINQKLIDTTCPKMCEFLDRFMRNGDILKLKSAMGTGKSKVIDYIINMSKTEGNRVLLISNRISVAEDYSNKYNIKTYRLTGDDAWKPGEDLIVQLDSLWKYDLRDFDIVILDEFVSLMQQTISSLKDNMRPFNAAKFYHILKSKKVVMADAFLSGYEDIFYDKKKIYYIQNNWRDKIDISYYERRETFVESILNTLKNKKETETVTASIMSNDVINTIYDIAEKEGYKVFKLTANTSEETKKIIYKLFEKEQNDKWDLLLYSPTLTVGVSNMNECVHHFHYDIGKAADVISSLQMVKRSRKMKHLHLYLKEFVKLEPTDVETLNDLFNQNIERYFKGNTNTVTIEVDENANFRLSPVGIFMNKIQAFQNRLENNHRLSFNVLLGEQFNFLKKYDIKTKSKLKFNQCIKDTKERIKKETIELINKYSNIDYSDSINELLKSKRTLSEEEKVQIILYELKQKLNTDDVELISEIAKKEIESDYKLSTQIKNLLLLYKKDIFFINNYIDNLISSGKNNNEFKEEVNFLNDISKLFNYKMSNWYSENEIKTIEETYKLNNFKKILKRLGYKKNASRFTINQDVIKYLKYFI